MATSTDARSFWLNSDLMPQTRVSLSRWASSWPTVLVALLMVWRISVPVFRAEFWAEDGAIFFPESFELGLSSLWKPVTGYHLLISRCIAYLATFFPAIAIPYVYVAGCLVFCSVAFSYFAREGFSWIVPSRGLRILLCCALAVGPGTSEVVFNLSNLQAPLCFLMGLMLLEKPFAPSPAKLLAFFLIFLSAGSTPVWVPLVLYLAWHTRRRRYLALVAIQVLIVAVNVLSHRHFDATSGIAPYADYTGLWRVPRVYFENYFMRLFFAPFLGQGGTGYLMKASNLVFWGSAALCLAALAVLLRRGIIAAEKARLLMLAYLCSVGILAMVAIVRAYNLPLLLREHGDLFWNGRYGFLPGCFSLLFWAALLLGEPERRGVISRWAGRIAISIPLLWYFAYRKQTPVRPNGNWPARAAELQAVLDAKRAGTLRSPVAVEGIVLQPLSMATTRVVISP